MRRRPNYLWQNRLIVFASSLFYFSIFFISVCPHRNMAVFQILGSTKSPLWAFTCFLVQRLAGGWALSPLWQWALFALCCCLLRCEREQGGGWSDPMVFVTGVLSLTRYQLPDLRTRGQLDSVYFLVYNRCLCAVSLGLVRAAELIQF